jgi:two-component system chemotaxis response regulator CheB
MVRVLIVDDSAFARLSITRALSCDPDIEIAGYAADGIEAVEKVKELHPGVVTLDVSMPRMNGLDALEHIMAEQPTPVVMLSSLTDKGTDITIRALEMGAVDFFLKASPSAPAGFNGIDESLNTKVKTAAKIGHARLRRTVRSHSERPGRQAKKSITRNLSTASKVVVIGSSTGGPELYQLIPQLPGDIPAAILMVQHMPPDFTRLWRKGCTIFRRYRSRRQRRATL